MAPAMHGNRISPSRTRAGESDSPAPQFLPTVVGCCLRTTKALAAIKALVTCPVADSHMSATGAGWCIRLKMGNGIAQAADRARMAIAVSEAIAFTGPHCLHNNFSLL